MRKAIVAAVLAVMVVGTIALWIVNTERSSDTSMSLNGSVILMMVVALVILVYGVLVILKGIRDAKNKLPAQDELSKKILIRGAATSYYISIYLWLAIMYFEERIELERSSLIGAGILGMAIIFALSWIYHRFIRSPHY
jgi:peptidoglycan/LPS O-acetylase OafA/YrhL